MAGERKAILRCVAALLVMASWMTFSGWSAPAASAHRSDWCRHSDKYGNSWWVAYDYHYDVYRRSDNSRTHHHWTDHFYGPPGGFKKFKHDQNKICAIYGGTPALLASTTAVNPSCIVAGVEVNQHTECSPAVDQDDVPVEALPGVSDPNVPDPDTGPLQGWIDWVFYCLSDTQVLPKPAHCNLPVLATSIRAQGVRVRWVRLEPGLDGRLLEQRVPMDDTAACLTSITDQQGRAFTFAPGNKVAVLETAPRALAGKIGHAC